MLYFLKSLLLYSHAFIGQTKYIVMITNEGSIKIVSFITPGAGVLVLGCGHISHLVKMHYFLKYLLYFYAIVLRDYGVAFLYQCWFSFILWWGCWYTNMSPSDKKSLILRLLLWPVGLFFFKKSCSPKLFDMYQST